MLPSQQQTLRDEPATTTQDFRNLRLKNDAHCKPFWVLESMRILLESNSPVYREAEALLIAIAEPVSRTRYLQEYQLTDYSLYAGASMGLKTSEILAAMDRFAKNELPPRVRKKIHDETSRYGKVKLVMRAHQLFVECRGQPDVLTELLRDPELSQYRPLRRFERASLHVTGRQRRVFSGAVRFLPSEMLGSFDNYRRVVLRYEYFTHLRVVVPDVPGSPRRRLQFRVQFGSEEELKRFHSMLVLDMRGDFDAANPAFDPQNSEHILTFEFYSDTDRHAFASTVLPAIRRQAQASVDEDAQALEQWIGAEPPTDAGVGVAAEQLPGAATVVVGPEDAMEAFRRRAEDADDQLDAHIEDFEVDPSKVMEVKARCRELRWPLLEEYDFRNDTYNAELPIELKHDDGRIRDYQEQALSRVFGNHRARSGIIVLPCGAGKTLVGIVAACTVRRSTVVLCNSSVSVEQWYQQFLMWAQIDRSRVSRFIAGSKEPLHKDACILISTYHMIGYTGHRSADARAVMADVSDREWGLMILDEVHIAPADTFLTCMTTRTRSRCKLGLTATLVREDGKIDVLNAQIGPKLFEANWLDLQERGYIAKVSCAEVWCEMTPEFYREYLRSSHAIQRLLYAMNPNKFRSCEFLMRWHEQRGDKVIIFSDNVFALREYARRLDRPWIDGDVKQNERMRWLQQFKSGGKYATILISKVGDTSIDLPEANVIIQIASHFGARRQEAQRLGRILRPKARTGSAFNAFFYTLISRDTQEMFYSSKRQQFLVDQGYAFRAITELTDFGAGEGLSFSTKKEQLDLLGMVLSANEQEVGAADEREEQEERRAAGGEVDDSSSSAGVVRKRGSSMSEFSGAGSKVYAEKTVGQERLLKAFGKEKQARSKK